MLNFINHKQNLSQFKYDSLINVAQRPAAKRSKGRAFEKQLCISIVAVSGMLGHVNFNS